MIGRTSTDIVSPTAFATIMPPRTAVASFCKTTLWDSHHRLRNAWSRGALAEPPTRTGHAVLTAFASPASASAQIPIAPRPC